MQTPSTPGCDVLPNNNSRTSATSHKSTDVVFPQLGLKVLIVGSCFLAGAVSMFREANCTRATSIEDAGLICYLGGEDVDPSLYGEKPLKGTYFNTDRDAAEIDVFTKALAAGKPQFGICRGMQFLHVMNGGKLWQNVDNHCQTHELTDIQTGQVIRCSSMHHQMCIEDETTFPLAYATGRASRYQAASHELASDRHDDLEAAVYPAINAIAVQGHPEVGGLPEYTAWCLSKVEEFIYELDMMGDNMRTYVNPDRIDEGSLPKRILN